jgi:hypothetical protein
MLIAAFVILGSAALLGTILAVLHLRSARPAWGFGGLHGLLGFSGLGCLSAALGGPPRGLGSGTATFGMVSAGLIVLAALVGGGLLVQRLRKRRLQGALIGIHATLAVSGFVALAAYIFVG